MNAYEVRLSPGAVRAFAKLTSDDTIRIRHGLKKLALDVAKPGRIGGKSVKSIRGASDTFHRLRVGDFRVMYDVVVDDRVILILGIVHRGDLERWLRNR